MPSNLLTVCLLLLMSNAIQTFHVQMSFVALSQTINSRQWHVRLTGGGMIAVFALYPRISTSNSVYSFRLHETFMANSSKLSEFDFKSLIGMNLILQHPGIFCVSNLC